MTGRRKPPDRPCPGCGTAELTHGRELCHACALLRIFYGAPR